VAGNGYCEGHPGNRTALLLSQLLMMSLQKKIAERFNINPGEDMLRAISRAEESGAEVVLADREIRVTLLRTWADDGALEQK